MYIYIYMFHTKTRGTSGAGYTALPRTAPFQLWSTAYRVFSIRPYRVPRLFNSALPRTASFQVDTTAYRVKKRDFAKKKY